MEASKADLDLAEIRERANNATPGPWEADRPQVWGPNDESVAFVTTHDPGEGSGQPEWEANTVFIAHAREDVPALLDHVDTLAAQLAAVRELHQEHGCDSVLLGCSIIVTGECSRVGTCEHCRRLYPCPTIQAIEGDQ